MLLLEFIQQWFNLFDHALEDALCDSESMHRFAGIHLAANPVAELFIEL
jgi:transposase, IS5 family